MNFIKKIINKLRSTDPVYNCPVFLNEGCAHVDGPLCDYPNCNIIKEYKSKTDIVNEYNTVKEPTLFRCTTDTEVYIIIAAKDIICMTPIPPISQDGVPYIRVEFEDNEFKITSSIYCSEVKPYLTPLE
jgi:hypothetical protein